MNKPDARAEAREEAERADFATFMQAMEKMDPVWQDRVVTAFSSSVSTRDWALLVSSTSDDS